MNILAQENKILKEQSKRFVNYIFGNAFASWLERVVNSLIIPKERTK